MYYDNPVIPNKYIAANPELKGKRAMDIFDIVVSTLTRNGLMVILNNHVSSSMWCCSESDGEGLWWTE
jgi:endoglucanase